METKNLPLEKEKSKKYRNDLAKKLNRSRFVSRNKLLKIFSNTNPQEILDKAKDTKEYTTAKELSLINRKEEIKPASKLRKGTKKLLTDVLDNSIEFVEDGKKYYMSMMKDIQSYIEQKESNIIPDKEYKQIHGDVLLSNEYGLVLGKWNYNTEALRYDEFLQMRGNHIPYTIVDNITKQLEKI